MEEHISYILVLLMTLLIPSVGDYVRFKRDWIGIRLIPGLLVARLPAITILTLLYLDFTHVIGSTPFIPTKYATLAYVVAAFTAEHLARHAEPQTGRPGSVCACITREKVKVADHLEAIPERQKILTEMVSQP